MTWVDDRSSPSMRLLEGKRPRVEQRLILFSAGTAARRKHLRGHAEQFVASVDWSLLAEMLRMRRLLPTLGPRILELAGERASGDFALAVEEAVDTGRRRGAFLQLIAERVMAALLDVEIRCTALKGPMLSDALYGDPGRRPSSDIDLLVAEEQMHRAVEVVRTLGYAAPNDHVGKEGMPMLHFAMVHEQGELPPVEIHWRIHWYERSFARDRLLAPAHPPAGVRWRPAPIDELTALLLFYARDGFIDLRHATDLGAWWDIFGAGLRFGALDESMRAYPELEHVLMVAASVAERTVGLPLDRLHAGKPRSNHRDRIAARLANPHPHASQAQLYADMGLIDGLLMPVGGFKAFIKRQVILPREVLREHARREERRRPSSRLGHGLRVLGRYALAIARLLRPAERLPLGQTPR
jgi:hypothetical protein